MSHKLLIDECLSPGLVQVAIDEGNFETTCSRDRDLLGLKDWELFEYALEHDYILVTHNAVDFRGRGEGDDHAVYAKNGIHPGLICLESDFGMDLDTQHRLFKVALAELALVPDLVNQVLEVRQTASGIEIRLYDMPDGRTK